MKFYDKENKKILIFENKSTPQFWDMHWEVGDIITKVKTGKNNRFIKKFTTKFLSSSLNTKILEGGCGIGQNVYGLQQWGYDAYGVDFAKKTVDRINKNLPELKISFQNVKKLNFPNNFFDGYWSLGVIEHFWNGYDEILQEMRRTIKPNGYLFLTFPYMSPLRKLKAKSGIYKSFRKGYKTDDFYQFILDSKKVKTDVEKQGFQLVLEHPFDATKGIKDEISFLKTALQKIYDSKNILAKGMRFLISLLLAVLAGHSILLIFKKL